MAKSTTGKSITLLKVRLSFVEIVNAKAFQEGQAKKFSLVALLDPSDKQHAAHIQQLKDSGREISTLHFGGAAKIPKNMPVAWRDGNEKDYKGWANMIALKLSSFDRPRILNRAKKEIEYGDAQFPYSGCYANVLTTLWVQDNAFNKRLNANLLAVQFVADGESFGGGARPNIDEAFVALEDSGDVGADPFSVEEAPTDPFA